MREHLDLLFQGLAGVEKLDPETVALGAKVIRYMVAADDPDELSLICLALLQNLARLTTTAEAIRMAARGIDSAQAISAASNTKH